MKIEIQYSHHFDRNKPTAIIIKKTTTIYTHREKEIYLIGVDEMSVSSRKMIPMDKRTTTPKIIPNNTNEKKNKVKWGEKDRINKYRTIIKQPEIPLPENIQTL